MENKKTIDSSRKYYPIPSDLIMKLTSSLEKTVHTGWLAMTSNTGSDRTIGDGFLVEIDIDASFKKMIEENNLKEKLGHNYIAKFKSIAFEIINDYLKDRYALVTDLINTERVFVHKISFNISGEGKDKVYNIEVAPDNKINLSKDKLAKIKKEAWDNLDDVANLRTDNNFYNLIFLDITPTTIKKVRLKLNKGKRDE